MELVPPAEKATPRQFVIRCCCGEYFAFVQLLNQRLDERTIDTTLYLSASHEVFGITLIVTWLLTLAFYPEQIINHPARAIIGSFNPCFGWDYAPASHVALVLCSINVFLTWRYSWLERTRPVLISPARFVWYESFAYWSCLPLMFASNAWLLLWSLGPATTGRLEAPTALEPATEDEVSGWLLHTGLFVFYAFGSWLAVFGNYVESRFGRPSTVQRKHTAFVLVYGGANLFLVSVYLTNLLTYELGKPPTIPPMLTQSVDLIWIACVASVTSFTPPEPPLRMTMAVLVEEDEAPLLDGASAPPSHAPPPSRAPPPGSLWGEFEADCVAKPAVGVDAASTWLSVAFFYALLPVHLLIGVLAGAVPLVGRWVTGLQILYAQSGVGGGPERRQPLLVPAYLWGLLMSAVNMFAKSGGRRFDLWDLLYRLQGSSAGGFFAFYEGFFCLQYAAVRDICASEQIRGRWLGACTAMCPEAAPSNLLLFLSGEHHKAVRSAMMASLLGPAIYQPRVGRLAEVLAPLLPSPCTLAAFVAADGTVNTPLCAKLVSRALWFLCFGEAGLLSGDELDVVAQWNSVPKVLFLPRALNRIVFGALAGRAASARKAVVQLLADRGLDALFIKMNEGLPGGYRRRAAIELADELMTGINFAGINGTVHLLASTLAHLVGHVSDIPAASLALPPTAELVPLYRRDPDAFIIETCRVDPPVTSACATFKEAGERVALGVGCCGVTTDVKKGTPLQYVFGGMDGPNRDAAVFAAPNTFDPARADLHKMLSWNGALEAPAEYPRFCPGQQLSMIMVKAILGSIDELKDTHLEGA